MRPKDADEMAKSVDPEQTAPDSLRGREWPLGSLLMDTRTYERTNERTNEQTYTWPESWIPIQHHVEAEATIRNQILRH